MLRDASPLLHTDAQAGKSGLEEKPLLGVRQGALGCYCHGPGGSVQLQWLSTLLLLFEGLGLPWSEFLTSVQSVRAAGFIFKENSSVFVHQLLSSGSQGKEGGGQDVQVRMMNPFQDYSASASGFCRFTASA